MIVEYCDETSFLISAIPLFALTNYFTKCCEKENFHPKMGRVTILFLKDAVFILRN